MAVKTKKTDLERLNGKLRQIIDPAVAKALSHPLRSHVLLTLGDRVASPNEIAQELGLVARDLDYHVKVLLEMGMIRLVRTRRRRGAKEHFYELSSHLMYIGDSEWNEIPLAIRSSLSASLLKIVVEDATAALVAGTFSNRENHQSRTPMLLDEEGWSELTGVMNSALEQVMQVQKASEARRKSGTKASIPATVYMLGFEAATGADRKTTG